MGKHSFFINIMECLKERPLMERYIKSSEQHDEKWFFSSEAKDEYYKCVTVFEKTWFIFMYVKAACKEVSEEMQFNIALAIVEKASAPDATVKSYPDIISVENNPVLNVGDKIKVLKRKASFPNDALTSIKGVYSVNTVKYQDLVSDTFDPEYKFERQIIFGIIPISDYGEYIERSPYAMAKNVEAINNPNGLGYRALERNTSLKEKQAELKRYFPKASTLLLRMNELCKQVEVPVHCSVKALMKRVYLQIFIIVGIILLIVSQVAGFNDMEIIGLYAVIAFVVGGTFLTVDYDGWKKYEKWKEFKGAVDSYVESTQRKQFIDDCVKFEEKYAEITKKRED